MQKKPTTFHIHFSPVALLLVAFFVLIGALVFAPDTPAVQSDARVPSQANLR